VVKKNTNPEWNEELTLSIEDPAHPVRLVCMHPLPSHFPLSFLNPLSCFFFFLPLLLLRTLKKEIQNHA